VRRFIGRTLHRARVRILLAVCAALAAIGGVLAAPAFAGGSAPASGSAASGLTALSSPISQSGHAGKSLLLINGDRLLINGKSTGKSTAVSLDGSGFPAALTELRIAGRQYVIPDVALPYLGRSLDLSLFDVAAQPGGATLPVRISYSGRTPRLPGVTITRAAGGAASGYLTARGAVSFAAALTRQFAADHAAASYGSDGLFAGGVWISARGVAGAAVTRAAAAARQRAAQKAAEPKTPAFKMHEVTLRGVTTNGKPDTGDLVFLFNAADNTIYGDPFEEPNAFYHGTARFSLPSGTYWALTWFTTMDRKGIPTGLRTVFVPRIAIKADATITLRAAAASSKVTFGTPKPSVLVLSSVQLAITDSRGNLSDFGLIQGPGFPVWLSPTTQRIPGGSLKEFVNVALQAPPGSAPAPATDPDLYSGVFQDTSGLIRAQHFTLSAASLATVHAVYSSDVDTTGGVQLAGFSTAELQTVGGGLAPIVAEQVPARITEHLLGGPGVFWENAYLQSLDTFGGGQTDAIRAFPAGADTTLDWNVYPLHTPLNSGEQAQVPGAQGFFGTPLSASRTANQLALDLNPFTDDTPGHVGTGFAQGAAGRIAAITGNYLIAVNGKQRQTGTIGGDEMFGTFFGGLTLPTAPSTVTLRLRASRTGALFPLSTAISDTWSWRSGTGLFDGLPPGWFCADGSARCEVEPLLNFGYQVGGIALDGTTAAGAQQVTLTAGHQALLPSPAAVTGVTAQFSLDNGTTWQPATVTGAGGTRTLAFAAPAGSYVSLKVSAKDAAGGTLSETIIKAFATQTAVAAARETAAQRAAELVTQDVAAPASVTAASLASAESAWPAAGPAAGSASTVGSASTAGPAGPAGSPGTAGTAGAAAAGGASRYRAACAAPGPGQAQCFVLVAPEPGSSGANADGIAVTAKKPAGWGPRDIEHAYRLPVGRGSRATVAVVEAFDTPKLETYLNDYRREWGLGSCTTANGCFRKVGQAGSAKHLPASGVFSGWDLEATLDVDMVSAACPACRILVVEANGQQFGQLSAGVKTAIGLGAAAVSNSYGGRETGQDLTDARAYNQPGHAIVVSTGDFGYSAASFPANLPTVTAAGGTELSRAANRRGWRETAWNTPGLGAGSSGCSAYVAKPSWQHDKNCPGRTVADVSAVAFNLAIYNKDWGGWTLVAGTSASSPIIGGIYGLAGNAAKVRPGYAYAHAKDLFDVISGNNDWFFNAGGRSCGKDYLCVAKHGYDAPTGLGTPDGLGAF